MHFAFTGTLQMHAACPKQPESIAAARWPLDKLLQDQRHREAVKQHMLTSKYDVLTLIGPKGIHNDLKVFNYLNTALFQEAIVKKKTQQRKIFSTCCTDQIQFLFISPL